MRGRGEFVFWVFRQRHVGAGCGSFRMRSHPRTPFPRRAARGCAHALFRKCLSTLHVILCSKKRSSSYALQSPPLYLPPHIVWAALATHTTFSTHKHARALAPHHLAPAFGLWPFPPTRRPVLGAHPRDLSLSLSLSLAVLNHLTWMRRGNWSGV